MRTELRTACIVMLAFLLACSADAQFKGPRVPDEFRDTSMLRPPAGSKVAIIVFEDLGCPGCARAHPLEIQASTENHVPLLRYDLPIPAHVWTFNAAVCARYLQDGASPQLADQYRSDVFAAQSSIESLDDLHTFNHRWMQQHNQPVPAVLDPDGKLVAEVQADYDLARRLGVVQTPTVVVVTRDNYQVVCGIRDGLNDPKQLSEVVRAAIAQSSAPTKQLSHR